MIFEQSVTDREFVKKMLAFPIQNSITLILQLIEFAMVRWGAGVNEPLQISSKTFAVLIVLNIDWNRLEVM